MNHKNLLRRWSCWPAILSAALAAAFSSGAMAEASQAEIAKQLNNPVANLTSVPFQFNYDDDLGPTKDGKRYLLNIQPVIPFQLNKDWTVISRTIAPVIKLEDVPPGNDEDGLGDILQSVFFAPAAPIDGWILGIGPALSLRTATDDLLGAEKWSAGPTAVALRQQDGWTIGALTNHLWSFAGNGQRTDVDATYIQPFLVYTTAMHTSYGINSESTYDWQGNDWSVPINIFASQVFKIREQIMSLQLGARYWADTPEDQGPDGWGWRLTYTLVFPKK